MESNVPAAQPFYAGISGLPMNGNSFDLGHGVSIRQTYIHLFAEFMAAFSPPAAPGKPHPGPWKATRGGSSFDITAELAVPAEAAAKFGSSDHVAWAIVFALRLHVTPNTTLAAYSRAPLTASSQTANDAIWMSAVEVETRRFPLFVRGSLGPDEAHWIATRWPLILRLVKESSEFALAADALSISAFVQRPALTLVALWAALEALFSPSTSELRFRVSALIAAYLEPPGETRRKRATNVGKLYDKRSAAAHGKPKHEPIDVVESFILLSEVVTKMLAEGHVPSKTELEQRLFGAAHAPPESDASSPAGT